MTDVPTLYSATVVFDDAIELLAALPAQGALAWVRHGEGLVGWGEAARYEVTGDERFSRANRWWSRVGDQANVDDAVLASGSGPIAFGSFAFDADPDDEQSISVLVVPAVVVGHREGKSWLTLTADSSEGLTRLREATTAITDTTERITTPGRVTWHTDPQAVDAWASEVSNAVERITRGELDKVVLARDLHATTENPIDPRHLLNRLAAAYPQCWAFAVDGLVGATPELLVRRTGDRITSRVLAGTVRTDADASMDGQLARELMDSDKDKVEHEYAVRSVAKALATHCTDLDVPSHPSVLRLANVQHLATDVTGMLAGDTSVLALAASLHPTAAVCGTPTERARDLIRQIEPLQRSRYAGPVGWMDARGDGEFGIALRCGEIDQTDPHRIRLFAGCGIVAGSRPAAEVAESEAKLLAMREALWS